MPLSRQPRACLKLPAQTPVAEIHLAFRDSTFCKLQRRMTPDKRAIQLVESRSVWPNRTILWQLVLSLVCPNGVEKSLVGVRGKAIFRNCHFTQIDERSL